MRKISLSERRVCFNHEWKSICFQSDMSNAVFLDYCQYKTEYPIHFTDGCVFISEADFVKLYSPDMKVVRDGLNLRIKFTDYMQYPTFNSTWLEDSPAQELVGGIPYWPITESESIQLMIDQSTVTTSEAVIEISEAPYFNGQVLYLPVTEIMGKAFSARVLVHHESGEMTWWALPLTERNTFAITFCDKFQLDPDYVEWLTLLRKKVYGDVFYAFWFEKGKRIMPYRLYIPSNYRSDRPQKAVITFPGGISNENGYCDRIPHGGFQREAELHDFMIIGVDGYAIATYFGSRIPILQTLDGIDYQNADPENPEGWPEESMHLRALAEQCLWETLKEISANWNVDSNNLFVMGNSAGSNASMYYLLNYPDVFRAAVPTGGFINYHFADLSILRPNSVFHIIGTEDEFGYNDMIKAYAEMDKLGIIYKKQIVGGANHSWAWTFAVKEIFDFLDSNVI